MIAAILHHMRRAALAAVVTAGFALTAGAARPLSAPWTLTGGLGLTTPLGNAFSAGVRPELTLGLTRGLGRGFSLGVENRWAFAAGDSERAATNYSSVYAGAYGAFNILSLTANTSTSLSLGVEAGLGWAHRFANPASSGCAGRLGLAAGHDFDSHFAFSLKPSLIWQLSGYTRQSPALSVEASVSYSFGAPVQIRQSSASSESVNRQVNTMRARLDTAGRGAVREVAVNNRNNTVYDVFFHKGSTEVSADQLANVARVANRLNQNPCSIVVIEGYASNDGNQQANERLARSRADAVAAILTGRYRIAPSRVVALGKGVGHKFDENSWNRVAVCTVKN